MTRIINPEWKESTISVHSGEGIDPETRALRRPIHMANSYELPTDIEELLHTIDWNNLEKILLYPRTEPDHSAHGTAGGSTGRRRRLHRDGQRHGRPGGHIFSRC